MNWTEPKVNYKRMYESLGRVYEIGVLKGIFYESLQNSLDANASFLRYDYNLEKRTLTIVDNGTGMDEKTLVEKYHGLAETDKDQEGRRKRYGLGASVFPCSCEMVKTITKVTGSQIITSLWRKDPAGILLIDSTDEDKKGMFSTGTRILLQEIDKKYLPQKNITKDMKKALKDVVYDYYYLAILNLQKKGSFELVFQGEKININPIKRSELVTSVGKDGIWEINEQVRIDGKNHSLYGYIYYLSSGSTTKSGLKFSTDKDLMILNRRSYSGFNISSDIIKRLGGIFQCTYLDDIQLMTRNGFDMQSKKWKDHEDIISRLLNPIIDEIMDYRRTRLTREEYKILQEINKCLETVLLDIPDFQVFGSIGLKGKKFIGLIEDKEGSLVLSGSKGSMISGDKDPHKPKEKTPIREGSVKGSKAIGVRRRRSGAPPITFVAETNKPAVYTAGDGLICINQENEMYKQTRKLSASIHKWYLANLVGTELTSSLPIPEDIRDDMAAISKHIVKMQKDFSARVTKYWFR